MKNILTILLLLVGISAINAQNGIGEGFDPENPANPGRNYFNAATGELIIDDFEPGKIMEAVDEVIGNSNNRSEVLQATVIGKMKSNDMYLIGRELKACTLFDFSRTNDYDEVPTSAFKESSAVSIILPECIKEIGSSAFADCGKLTEMTVLAVTPPTVNDENAFSGVPEGLVVRVMSRSLPLYAEADVWKNFTLLPLDNEVHSLEVALPENAADGRYNGMSIELVNTESGQTQKQVVTDRLTYTFYGLLAGSTYNVYLKNTSGETLAIIENIMIEDEDVKVAFGEIIETKDVTLTVLTPEGTDVTAQTEVEWTDADGKFVASGPTVQGIIVGTELYYKVTIDQSLGMEYKEPGTHILVVGEQNEISLTLERIGQVMLSGTVKDEDGQPIHRATVTVTQNLNGKYPKSLMTTTEADGSFSLYVYCEDAAVSVSSDDYITETLTVSGLTEAKDLGDIILEKITGARIGLNLTFTPSVAEGETAETQDWYEDYENIEYSLYNNTARKEIEKFSVQYPTIVLTEASSPGDILTITASSKKGAFKPVTADATPIDTLNYAEVTIPIVELGGIRASFSSTDNTDVVGLLYDADGQLMKKYAYADASLEITGLQDSRYTLVTMTGSDMFNSILNLSQFAASGLAEGTDYVKNDVDVKSGVIAVVSNDMIPVFDESKLYYTGDNTSFTVNKTSIVIGNYLTLKAKIDFKDEYASGVSGVNLVVDLPASCLFVENSVMVGTDIAVYSFEGSRLTIPVSDISDDIRFCVIPTESGTYSPGAFARFTLDGEEILQPIGNAIFDAKDISINIPSSVNDETISISGTGRAHSSVSIYDNGTVIGTTESLANGKWNLKTKLHEPINLSEHYISAQIITDNGVALQTEKKKVTYDVDFPEVEKVTMINTAHPTNSMEPCEYVVTFDFINPTTKNQVYWYWPDYPTFTFMINLSHSDYGKPQNVKLYVLTEKQEYTILTPLFDEEKGCWIANGDFHSGNLPINVGVSYDVYEEEMSDEKAYWFVRVVVVDKDDNTNTGNLKDDYEFIDVGDNTVTLGYKGDEENALILKKIQNIDDNNFVFNFMSEGNEYELTTSLISTNEVPADYEEIKINKNHSIYQNITSSDADSEIKLLYPTSLIEKFIQLSANDETVNNFLKNMLADNKKYVGIQTRTNCVSEYDYLEDEELGRLLNEALNNCPTLGSLTDAIANRSEKNHKDNNTLQPFNDFFGALEEFENTMEHFHIQIPPLANAALQGAGTAGDAMELGQEIGNYVVDRQIQNDLQALISAGCLPQDPHPTQPTYPSNNPAAEYVMDPSGYVYEAVSSNRLEGVKATCYYKEGENGTGVVWNAADYAQENPLFTDENGMYRWDVPQGLWQVRFEKEGYQATQSEWLPVPPPQLEVNIAMTQTGAPEVKAAHAYEDGIDVEFSKYMMPEDMTTDNIFATVDGKKIEGTIEMKDEERAYEDDEATYVSKVRFTPLTKFTAGDEVTLSVSRRVRSYAGTQMAADFSQQFDIVKEVKRIAADSIIQVQYNGGKRLTVSVVPFDAAVGMTLKARSASEMIATVTPEAVIDENGQATLDLKGELPGVTAMTFTIDGIDARAVSTVRVVTGTDGNVTVTPQASHMSGTDVYKGTAVTLTCDDKGAVIYYTTDGSCPCDEQGRRLYTEPITIDADMTIKAVAVADGKEESDVAEFAYRLKRAATAMKLHKGWNWLSHNLDTIVSAELIAGGETETFISCDGTTTDATPASASYKAKVGTDRSYTLQGIQINPADMVINLREGWNWIGYPLGQTLTVSEAMQTAQPDEHDCIVGQEGFAQFAGGKWQGSLKAMRPGQGYMYMSGSSKAFTYFSGTVSKAQSLFPRNAARQQGAWTTDVYAYADMMCVIAELYDDGAKTADGRYTVGAFCGAECRSVGKYEEGKLWLNVIGKAGDEITFMAYDNESGLTYHVKETLTFGVVVEGSADLPYAMHLGDEATGIEEVTHSGDMKARISDGKLYVTFGGDIDYVTLHSADGVCVFKSAWGAATRYKDVSWLPTGVYVLSVSSNGKTHYAKLTNMK